METKTTPFGAALRRLRRARDITQETLSYAAGVSRMTIFRLEKGHTDPSPELAATLAKLLGVTVKELR